MSDVLHYEDLQVGDRWTSQGRTVTESDVVNFAGLTGDYDPLHVDHAFAQRAPFGRPIAHGLLGLSFLAGLSSSCPRVNTVALVMIREWKFKHPIYFGDTIHVETEVEQLERSGRRHGLVTWRRRLLNQKQEVVQEGTLETLVTARDGSAAQKKTPEHLHAPRPHATAYKSQTPNA